MPNTSPTLDEPGVLARIRAAAAASGSPVELLAIGAVTTGRAGETLAAIGESRFRRGSGPDEALAEPPRRVAGRKAGLVTR